MRAQLSLAQQAIPSPLALLGPGLPLASIAWLSLQYLSGLGRAGLQLPGRMTEPCYDVVQWMCVRAPASLGMLQRLAQLAC